MLCYVMMVPWLYNLIAKHAVPSHSPHTPLCDCSSFFYTVPVLFVWKISIKKMLKPFEPNGQRAWSWVITVVGAKLPGARSAIFGPIYVIFTFKLKPAESKSFNLSARRAMGQMFKHFCGYKRSGLEFVTSLHFATSIVFILSTLFHCNI